MMGVRQKMSRVHHSLGERRKASFQRWSKLRRGVLAVLFDVIMSKNLQKLRKTTEKEGDKGVPACSLRQSAGVQRMPPRMRWDKQRCALL
jgi:hypothetical protein